MAFQPLYKTLALPLLDEAEVADAWEARGGGGGGRGAAGTEGSGGWGGLIVAEGAAPAIGFLRMTELANPATDGGTTGSGGGLPLGFLIQEPRELLLEWLELLFDVGASSKDRLGQ